MNRLKLGTSYLDDVYPLHHLRFAGTPNYMAPEVFRNAKYTVSWLVLNGRWDWVCAIENTIQVSYGMLRPSISQ